MAVTTAAVERVLYPCLTFRLAIQAIFDAINDVRLSYSLYRQTAFVARTIRESEGCQYTEEVAAVTAPFATRNRYQVCDWSNSKGVASNCQDFYGLEYMQLSWSANYKAYAGRARMINGDPDYFYRNPGHIAALPYSMDASAWFFEAILADDSGRFGLTTNDINGPLECNAANNIVGSKPQKRWQIFEALAEKVGLTSYSESGCYN